MGIPDLEMGRYGDFHGFDGFDGGLVGVGF